MPRTPAKYTQADIARAIRAMRQCGYDEVRVRVLVDGTVIIERGQPGEPISSIVLEASREFRL